MPQDSKSVERAKELRKIFGPPKAKDYSLPTFYYKEPYPLVLPSFASHDALTASPGRPWISALLHKYYTIPGEVSWTLS